MFSIDLEIRALLLCYGPKFTLTPYPPPTFETQSMSSSFTVHSSQFINPLSYFLDPAKASVGNEGKVQVI